ncbi:MAG: hypothetical protein ABSC37_10370 [Xanthobacteraceae bacterium]
MTRDEIIAKLRETAPAQHSVKIAQVGFDAQTAMVLIGINT